MIEKTEILVFDLYDTLIEINRNNHFFYQLYKLSNDGFGITIDKYKSLLLKTPLEEIFNLLAEEFEDLFYKNKLQLDDELNSVRLFDDSLAILEKIRENYVLCLISNLATPYKEPFFNLGLDKYFEKVIFSCDIGLIKPEVEIFKIVETYTHKRGKQIMMIGDSEKSDIEGARQMSWRYVKVSRKRSLKSKHEIKDLYSLLNKITTYDKS